MDIFFGRGGLICNHKGQMNLGASLQIHSNMHSVCPHSFVSQHTEITYITHTKLHNSRHWLCSKQSFCLSTFIYKGWIFARGAGGLRNACPMHPSAASLPASQPASQAYSQVKLAAALWGYIQTGSTLAVVSCLGIPGLSQFPELCSCTMTDRTHCCSLTLGVCVSL